MPKDIRSYFKGPAAKSDQASKPQKRTAEDDAAQATVPPKKRKVDAAATVTKKAATKEPTPKKPVKKATPKKESGGKSKAATRKAHVIDSDSDDEDFEEEAEESEEDDIVIGLSSSGSEEDPSPPKRAKTGGKSPATAPSSKATAPKPKATEPPSKASPPKAKAAATASKAPTPKPKASAAPSRAPAKTAKAAKEEDPPDVKAAVAAVDKAAEKLPEIVPDLMSSEGFGNGNFDTPPPNAGQKDIPKGHPECLRGKTFVITGVLDSLWRNEAEDLIKRHNGRITSAVSGKTTYLLTGTQAGKSKTASAVAKGTKIIDEDGLLSLIKAAPAPAAVEQPVARAPLTSTTAAKLRAELNKPPPASRPSSASRPSGGASSSRAAGTASGGGQLWVEKYRPKAPNELVGNPTVVSNLRQWLQSWEAVHLHGKEAEAQKGRGKPKDMGKKAVLLSGPPGIGKTTSAMIVTRELGYTPVEVNASDTRNKADSKVVAGIGGKLSNAIKELATNTALGTDSQGKRKKICLVMDEVDGMSGGDRGGVTELIASIKSSKVPIICICNDKYNTKLRSLRNSVLELEFRKPTKQQIASRMTVICRQEGLSVNEAALDALAEGANGDIRLVLGQLQMVRLRSTSLTFDQAKGKLGTNKDADMSPFEAARRLLSPETVQMSLIDRTELVFQDMDLVPLLIQENYLNHRPVAAKNNPVAHIQIVAAAADSFSRGDIVNRSVRAYQNWSLMPFAATIGSVRPAAFMRGSRETFFPGEMNFPRFSAWLGQNSSHGKQKRLLGELHARMSASGSCNADRFGLRSSYLPALRKILVKPLVDHDKDGIDPVINLMEEYCMNKEDFDYIQSVTHFKGSYPWNEDLYKSVATTTKSAFTRQLNAAISKQRPKSNIMVEEFKIRKGKKAAAVSDAEPAEGLGGDPELEAAEAERRAKENQGVSEEEEEEEELTMKEAAALALKTKSLARRGITFEAKGDLTKGKKSGGRGGGRGSGGRGSGGAASSSGRGRGRASKAK